MSDNNTETKTIEALVCSVIGCYKNRNGVCNSWRSYQDKKGRAIEQACKNFKSRADFSLPERLQVWNTVTRLWLRHYAACGKCDLCIEYATMLRERGMKVIQDPKRPTTFKIVKESE